MIFGIGTDILEIARVERIYARHGERFAEHLLLPDELTLFRGHARPARFLAMRFAAKEAIVKAMGTGCGQVMWIRDSGVLPNAFGRPQIIWSQRGQTLCQQLGIGEGHMTLTDEAGLVVAVAVLMRKLPFS